MKKKTFFILNLFFLITTFCCFGQNEDDFLYLSPLDKNKVVNLMKQNVDKRFCQNAELIDRLSNFQYNDHPICLTNSLGFFAVNVDEINKIEIDETGGFKPHIVELIKEYINPGSTVLEIGTNFGTQTLSLSKAVGLDGKVLVLETDPKKFNNLFMNLAINNVKNTKLFFTTNANSDLNKNFNFSFDQINIDSLGLNNISLIKIDIKNIEETILDGMKETLEKHHPVILLKITKNHNNSETVDQTPKANLYNVEGKLQSMNYTIQNIESNDYIAYPNEQKEVNKKVLLAILAKNKAHVLQAYLKCIDNLDYDKKLIGIYINTNNNIDNTKSILKNWADKNKNNYRFIYYENCENQEYSNDSISELEKYKILGKIRNKSLKKAKHFDCDYYFVVDCDNFITPSTLKDLVQKDKPIIAPMLTSIPTKNDPYSNFFYSISENGYYMNHPDYYKILNKSMTGTFKVPLVHHTYLIKTSYIDKLNYIDDTNRHEFIVFSEYARNNNVEQYICNEKQFGYLLHLPNESISLEEKEKRIKALHLTLDTSFP